MESQTKSVLVQGEKSVLIDKVDPELGEETEIVAHVTIGKEGGWGWVVAAGAFFNLFFLDGIAFSFGSLLNSIAVGFNQDVSYVSLINSIAIAVYYIAAPLASSLANRFGFRATAMIGSTICVLSCFAAFWGNHIIYLCVFYGFFAGFGFAFINLASTLVVSFYFEKLRPIAMAITSTGSSFGVMTLGLANKIIADSDGWRTVILMHSVCLGLVFFISMLFKPTVTVTVKKAGSDLETCKTVTVLPSTKPVKPKSKSDITSDTESSIDQQATFTEKVFGTSRNINYPTSAAVISAPHTSEASKQAGPSSQTGEEIYELTTYKSGEPCQSLLSHSLTTSINQLQGKDILKPSTPDKDLNSENQSSHSFWFAPDTTAQKSEEADKKKKTKSPCCKWKPEVSKARPLYRDDAFFRGNVFNLPEYQKSRSKVKNKEDARIQYALEVSRAVGTEDLKEEQGVMTTAMRRVLATMLDLTLLKLNSYKLLCLSNLSLCTGILIPYVYLPTWAMTVSISQTHCNLFLSTIGLSAALGKITWGLLASKLKPIKLACFSQFIAGLSTCGVPYLTSVYYVYANCFIYGFCISSVNSLRCSVLVDLYGLDKLTNAVGIVLVFNGVGSLVGTPIAGILINEMNYGTGFIFSGSSILFGSLLLMITYFISIREKRKVIKL